MANPQKEHGHLSIAHELLGAVLQYPFTTYELKVLLYILGRTFGWGTKKAKISYGEISRATTISRRHMFRTCKKLRDENVIFIQVTRKERDANIMGINKDYQSWGQWGDRQPVDKLGGYGHLRGHLVTPQGTSSPLSGDTPGDMSGDTPGDIPILYNRKKIRIKAERSITRPFTRPKSTNQKADCKALPHLLAGLERCFKKGQAYDLVEKLVCAGYDEARTWAAIVQARSKKNPAGYFVKTMVDPKFAIADSAHEQAKKEMREERRG